MEVGGTKDVVGGRLASSKRGEDDREFRVFLCT